MFKFRFSDDNETEERESNSQTEIQWFPCKEIFLTDIKSDCDSYDELFILGEHKINCVPYSYAIKKAISRGSDNISIAETQHSDLIPGKYEGGMKIWECTRDIADYLETKLTFQWKDKKVLDLGCGAGILGILALMQGANVVFQDYNEEVLELLTGPNILHNVPNLEDDKVQLYSGDWESFIECFISKRKGYLFDIILTAETIYNPSNYSKLHDVVAALLSPDGVCYLGGKTIYFGVGGSIHGFMEYINANDKLSAESCWSNSKGIAREILKITHYNNSS